MYDDNGIGFGGYVILEYGVECSICSTIGHGSDYYCEGGPWETKEEAERYALKGGWAYNEFTHEWVCPDEDCQARHEAEMAEIKGEEE